MRDCSRFTYIFLSFCDYSQYSAYLLSASIVKTLIEKRRTTKLDGFISKAQNKFNAFVILNNDYKVEFDFS
ncbi:hypothetical protein CMV00_01900 [Elizabethkingia anophelis]|nr:hypothetical protein [Elizabethkingia anophelis]